MPPTRRTRSGKTPREREYFTREIKKVDYQPTIDESLDFHSSDDNQSDLSISKVAATRPPKIKERLADHFKENWITWVVGGISVLLVFLFSPLIGISEK